MKTRTVFSERSGWAALPVGRFVFGTSTFGQVISMVPTRTAPGGSPAATWGNPIDATFNETLGCWEYKIPAGGEQIQINIYGEGWANFPGVPDLRAVQATVIAAGYSNGQGGDLVPLGWPGTPLDGAYIPRTYCSPTFGGDGRPCVSPFSLICTVGGGICVYNSDYIFPGTNHDLSAVCVSALDYGWSSATTVGSVTDPGVRKVFGTLVLEVPANAAGTYVIAVNPDRNVSFMAFGFTVPIPGLMFTAACITVITGSCCSDIGPGTTVCTDGLTADECDILPGPRLFTANETCAEPCPAASTGKCCYNIGANTVCADGITTDACDTFAGPRTFTSDADCSEPCPGDDEPPPPPDMPAVSDWGAATLVLLILAGITIKFATMRKRA